MIVFVNESTVKFVYAYRLTITLVTSAMVVLVAALSSPNDSVDELLARLAFGIGALSLLAAWCRLLGHEMKPLPGETVKARDEWDAARKSAWDFMGKSFAFNAAVWVVGVAAGQVVKVASSS